jgi:hypothetical protein
MEIEEEIAKIHEENRDLEEDYPVKLLEFAKRTEKTKLEAIDLEE